MPFSYSAFYGEYIGAHKSDFWRIVGFCFKTPKRLFWLIKGLFLRIGFRLKYKREHKNVVSKYYFEKQGVNGLIEVQKIVDDVRKFANVEDYHFDDNCTLPRFVD